MITTVAKRTSTEAGIRGSKKANKQIEEGPGLNKEKLNQLPKPSSAPKKAQIKALKKV